MSDNQAMAAIDYLATKDAEWIGARLRDFDEQAFNYSVPLDKIRMVFARSRGQSEILPVFEVLVIDQHGKPYLVGLLRDAGKMWREDGMSRMDPVSPRYSVEDLRRRLAETQAA